MILDADNLMVRLPQSERAAAWAGRRLTKQGSGFKAKPTKVEEAATRKLRREIERQREEQAEARRAERKERGMWK